MSAFSADMARPCPTAPANPYNSNHTADPDPGRHWDSQYPSLWVTDGGGGTFLDIWTPSTYAQAGMLVSDTETEGRAYQISSEHHVRHEVQVKNAAHWRFYALQTEEERGESGFALPIEVDSSRDITFANFHSYRVISSFQPFPWAVKVSNSRDIRFRNFHCDSNSKAALIPPFTTRPMTSSSANMSSPGWTSPMSTRPQRVAHLRHCRGAKLEKLAGGFFNISGGDRAARRFLFRRFASAADLRWDASSRQLSTVSDHPLEPVNLVVDKAGNLMVISYAAHDVLYALDPSGE